MGAYNLRIEIFIIGSVALQVHERMYKYTLHASWF